MRGRVGRSNKKAFCYFITPPLSSMSTDAQKRIKTVEQFSAIGSGIQIAMKDLEIRGAGDLLGGEQSGFINEMGFETYQKILQQAIEELKENEFKSVYNKDENDEINFLTNEIQIDTDLEILIPDHYINIVKERLALYQELSKIKSSVDLEEFEKQIAVKQKHYALSTRETLIKALRAQYQGLSSPKKVDAQLSLLAKETTFTVTTGHQLNLFTGPLYFFYKILVHYLKSCLL